VRIQIVALFAALILGTTADGQDARAIIQKSLDQLEGESSYATMTMKIIRPSWSRELAFKAWSLGTEYSIILITDPARDKGTVFLKRDKELWSWQPRIERSVKLPPSMMLQSWMGSDFTNDDLVRQSSIVEDYTHTIIGEEAIEERPCYIIELIPNEDAPVVWGKMVTWITKQDYLTLKTEFYDDDGFLVNTMIGSRIKRMDDRDLPSLLEIFPADEEGNKTVIEYTYIEFNINTNPAFFSVRNMRQVK
jgi:outer membrane lipoprotein-sorting protein